MVLQVYVISWNWNKAVGVSFYSLGSLKIIIAPYWHQSYEHRTACEHNYKRFKLLIGAVARSVRRKIGGT